MASSIWNDFLAPSDDSEDGPALAAEGDRYDRSLWAGVSSVVAKPKKKRKRKQKPKQPVPPHNTPAGAGEGRHVQPPFWGQGDLVLDDSPQPFFADARPAVSKPSSSRGRPAARQQTLDDMLAASRMRPTICQHSASDTASAVLAQAHAHKQQWPLAPQEPDVSHGFPPEENAVEAKKAKTKRPPNAFQLFCRERRATGLQGSFGEQSTQLGNEWATLSSEGRKRFTHPLAPSSCMPNVWKKDMRNLVRK